MDRIEFLARHGAAGPRRWWRARGRGIGLRLCLAALLLGGGAVAEPVTLRVTPVPLAYEDPQPERVGALRPRGAVEFHAPRERFGGFSGLHLDASLNLTAISDVGHWLTARLELDADGHLAGLADAQWAPLSDGAGKPLPRGRLGDAESLARLADGTWLVGFERWHRIRAYRDIAGPGRFVAPPPGLERLPANGGLESLAVLADGRVLALAEQPDVAVPGGRARLAWMRQDGRWIEGSYAVPAPFVPVDAAGLPDGGVLVLERRFSLFTGFGSRITRLAPPGRLEPGFRLEPVEVARIEPPLVPENYEGIAATRDATGRLLVAVISDDNLSILQRTRLLLFELPPP